MKNQSDNEKMLTEEEMKSIKFRGTVESMKDLYNIIDEADLYDAYYVESLQGIFVRTNVGSKKKWMEVNAIQTIFGKGGDKYQFVHGAIYDAKLRSTSGTLMTAKIMIDDIRDDNDKDMHFLSCDIDKNETFTIVSLKKLNEE